MFVTARDIKRSLFIGALSHVRNLLKHEKLPLHSHDVTRKVHLICNNFTKFGNLVLLPTFIDITKVAARPYSFPQLNF